MILRINGRKVIPHITARRSIYQNVFVSQGSECRCVRHQAKTDALPPFLNIQVLHVHVSPRIRRSSKVEETRCPAFGCSDYAALEAQVTSLEHHQAADTRTGRAALIVDH